MIKPHEILREVPNGERRPKKSFQDFLKSTVAIEKFLHHMLDDSKVGFHLCNALSKNIEHPVGKHKQWNSPEARLERKGEHSSAGQDMFIYLMDKPLEQARIKFNLREMGKLNGYPQYSLPREHNGVEQAKNYLRSISMHFCLITFKNMQKPAKSPLFGDALYNNFLENPLMFWADSYKNLPDKFWKVTKKNQTSKRVNDVRVYASAYDNAFTSARNKEHFINRLIELINNKFE